MLVGYARISPQDPDLTIQTTALQQAGCGRICKEHFVGGPLGPGLELALKLLQKGDTLIVLSLECLDCEVKQLIRFLEKLERRGIHFKSLTDDLDSRVCGGYSFFQWIKR